MQNNCVYLTFKENTGSQATREEVSYSVQSNSEMCCHLVTVNVAQLADVQLDLYVMQRVAYKLQMFGER